MLSVLLVCALSTLLRAGLPNNPKVPETGNRTGCRQAHAASAELYYCFLVWDNELLALYQAPTVLLVDAASASEDTGCSTSAAVCSIAVLI